MVLSKKYMMEFNDTKVFRKRQPLEGLDRAFQNSYF